MIAGHPGFRTVVLVAVLAILAVSCAGAPPRNMDVPHTPAPPPAVTGEVTLTFAGTFGDSAGFRTPWGLSFGVDGTLYVCDRDRSRIVRLDTDGSVRASFSGYGTRTDRLYAPVDVSSAGGIEVFVVDAATASVLRFDRNLRNAFTVFSRGMREARLFGTFSGLAADTGSGDLYLADSDNDVVIRLDMLGQATQRGSFGAERGGLVQPAGLSVGPDGALYVADTGAGRVAVFAHYGAPMRILGEDVLEAPVDVEVLPDGLFAVADERGIVVLDDTGVALGRAGFGVDRVMKPRGIAWWDGRLYVSDSVSSTVLVYDHIVPEQ
jgi:DNA-binding beta-propeller fold protein YncE